MFREAFKGMRVLTGFHSQSLNPAVKKTLFSRLNFNQVIRVIVGRHSCRCNWKNGNWNLQPFSKNLSAEKKKTSDHRERKETSDVFDHGCTLRRRS